MSDYRKMPRGSKLLLRGLGRGTCRLDGSREDRLRDRGGRDRLGYRHGSGCRRRRGSTELAATGHAEGVARIDRGTALRARGPSSLRLRNGSGSGLLLSKSSLNLRHGLAAAHAEQIGGAHARVAERADVVRGGSLGSGSLRLDLIDLSLELSTLQHARGNAIKESLTTST